MSKTFRLILGLILLQQVDQQRRQAGVLQRLGNELVAGAEPAAPTAMGERDDSPGLAWDPQDPLHPPHRPAGISTIRSRKPAFILCVIIPHPLFFDPVNWTVSVHPRPRAGCGPCSQSRPNVHLPEVSPMPA